MSRCAHCGRTGRKLEPCPRCRTRHYCSLRCQHMHWEIGRHALECAAMPLAGRDADRDALLDLFPHQPDCIRLTGQARPHVRAYGFASHPAVAFLNYRDEYEERLGGHTDPPDAQVLARLFEARAKLDPDAVCRLHMPASLDNVDCQTKTCVVPRLASVAYAMVGEDDYEVTHEAHGDHPAHTYAGRTQLQDLVSVHLDWVRMAEALGSVLGAVHFGAGVDTPEFAVVLADDGTFHVLLALDLTTALPTRRRTDRDVADRLAYQLTRLSYVPSPEWQPVLFRAFATAYVVAAGADANAAKRVIQCMEEVFLS